MARTMRAWVVGRQAPVAERPLELTELPVPEPGPGQVRVRVHACGVCRTDLHVVEGDLAARRPRVVPGHQVVGAIDAIGPGVSEPRPGTRVGVAWLHRTCGACRFCARGAENLCDQPEFTGWTVDGGYAEYCVAPAAFTYPLPAGVDDLQAAPLLCAGIIGFRALRLTGIYDPAAPGRRLGIYGFGAAGHVAIQLARARGLEVHVMTRDRERHQALARELGAASVGDAYEAPPVPLDAAIVFAPAGALVPAALTALDKGGNLVLGGIHMSPIPELQYALLYGERSVRTVANNTRADGRELLAEAGRVGVRTHVERFAFARADAALQALATDGVRGAAVIEVP